MITADWSFPTRIRIGPGRVRELTELCAELGLQRPLVVTDIGLAASTVFAAVLDCLDGGPRVAVFAQVHADPTEDDVHTGVAAFRAHHADAVIAVGGGSALDVGKLIALMSEQDRPVWDLIDGTAVWRQVPASSIPPVIAIPTTAGTGSEVGRAAVITDPTCTKQVIFHPAMLPAAVICDAELTVSLPPALTAGTGMDALSHALEAYCSPAYHPAADGIAMTAVAMVLEHLPRVITDPGDIESRQEMLAAALMGATAFQKGLGAMHALAHPIGAHHHVHHGTTTAVLMPPVLRANRPAIDTRVDRLAGSLGLTGGFDAVLERLLGLRSQIGLPATLGELGVRDPDVASLARAACADASAATNPIPMTPDWAAAILIEALGGDSA